MSRRRGTSVSREISIGRRKTRRTDAQKWPTFFFLERLPHPGPPTRRYAAEARIRGHACAYPCLQVAWPHIFRSSQGGSGEGQRMGTNTVLSCSQLITFPWPAPPSLSSSPAFAGKKRSLLKDTRGPFGTPGRRSQTRSWPTPCPARACSLPTIRVSSTWKPRIIGRERRRPNFGKMFADDDIKRILLVMLQLTDLSRSVLLQAIVPESCRSQAHRVSVEMHNYIELRYKLC